MKSSSLSSANVSSAQASSTPSTDPTAAPKPAGLPRRFAAMVYDSLLLIALGLGYGAIVTAINVAIQGAPTERQALEWGPWQPLVFVGLIMVLVGFYYFFWGRSGQTLGMRAWRLKLVDQDSQRLASPGQRLARALLAPISFAALGLGYFWLWIDPEHHTVHGRLTRTRVLVMPKGR